MLSHYICFGQSSSLIGQEIQNVDGKCRQLLCNNSTNESFCHSISFDNCIAVTSPVKTSGIIHNNKYKNESKHQNKDGKAINNEYASNRPDNHKSVFLEKCNSIPFDVFNHQSCQICSHNIMQIHDFIYSFLMMSSGYIKQVMIICDLGTPFGSWILPLTLDFISSQFSFLPMIVVLIKPHLPISGISNYYSLLSIHSSLLHQQSYCVIIRDIQDAIVLAEKESSFINNDNGSSFAMNQIYFIIACDLWVCLLSSVNDLNLFDICSFHSKIIDIRSSLYRLLQKLEKKNKNNKIQISNNNINDSLIEYNYLRAMSSNIHSLHMSYQPLHDKEGMSQYCAYAQLDCLQNRRKSDAHMSYYFHLNDNHKILLNELMTSLHWAAPNVTWNTILRNTSNDDMNDMKSIYSNISTNSISSNSSRSGMTNNIPYSSRSDLSRISRMSTISSHNNNNNNNNNQMSNNNVISLLYFQSKYGQYDLKAICDQSKKLIDCGAYIHIAEEEGFSASLLLDMIHNIEAWHDL
eukprot:gene6090-8393_t